MNNLLPNSSTEIKKINPIDDALDKVSKINLNEAVKSIDDKIKDKKNEEEKKEIININGAQYSMNYKGILDLSGLKVIDKDTIQQLSKINNLKKINLNGLIELDKDTAKLLVNVPNLIGLDKDFVKYIAYEHNPSRYFQRNQIISNVFGIKNIELFGDNLKNNFEFMRKYENRLSDDVSYADILKFGDNDYDAKALKSLFNLKDNLRDGYKLTKDDLNNLYNKMGSKIHHSKIYLLDFEAYDISKGLKKSKYKNISDYFQKLNRKEKTV